MFLYIFLTVISVYIFWPTLWSSPIKEFSNALEQISKYPQSTGILYFGQNLKSTDVPWHYTLGWLLVITPISYIVLSFLGLFRVFRNKLIKWELTYVLLWFFLPLFAVIFFDSVLYDGMRQMFFIYPAFLIFWDLCI